MSDIPAPLRTAAKVALAAVLLIGTFLYVRWWDLVLPSFGHNAYQAVFLSNGQVFFGRYSDRVGPYAKLVAPYYIQGGAASPDQASAAQPRIVRRGAELHAPLPEMLVPHSSILFVEDLSESSPVAQFMAKDQK